jgi:hypothetical protein
LFAKEPDDAAKKMYKNDVVTCYDVYVSSCTKAAKIVL